MQEPDKLQLYEILAREHEPMLMAYILSLVSDTALAEDIAQETFLIAYRKLSTLKKEDSFAAWLRGIARFEVLAALRRRESEIPCEPAVLDAMEEVFHSFEQTRPAEQWEERFKLVEDCFNLLPEALHTVCRLHYFEDRKAREIAEQLAIGLGAVLKRLERARQAIRDCVQGRLKTGESHG
jgi:RNA polymerase sigma-70 factor (ECF subfamily)